MHGNVATKALLSRPEQILYGRLVRAFPGHIVLSQVALSRLLVSGTQAAGDVPTTANRFAQLIADFVVCKADFTAVAVVELDDGACPSKAARDRDRRKQEYLHAAGVKVVHFPAGDIPSESALRALIAALPPHGSTVQTARRAS
jgi:uncharacterized protein YceH (UPF0502 family)